MTIHKEGYTSIALCVLFIFVLNVAVLWFWPDSTIIKWIAYVISFALFIIILQFFRNPRRTIVQRDNIVLAPADGKVVVIEEAVETEYFKDKRLQVSIFMSPVNVHINRNPVSGVVSFFKYHPGKYLVAWHPKSSTLNERTTVAVKSTYGPEILFRQIAGALARRIVWYVKEKDEVKQGEEFGFIKFGSRVDIFLPIGTKVNVAIGDKVTGGISQVAQFD